MNTRKRRVVLSILLLVVGFVAVGALVSARRKGIDLHRMADTNMQLTMLCNAVDAWSWYHDRRLPGPDFSDVQRALYAERQGLKPFFEFKMFRNILKTGKDSWGKPIKCEVTDDRRRATFRSCGPNGIDDQGQGDDIEIVVTVP